MWMNCMKWAVGIFCLSGMLPLAARQAEVKVTLDALRQNFCRIPDQQPLAVYWYWISDNISKEGVVKDLHAMRQAGITRAYIGNIGGIGIPSGGVKLFSDEWWDVLHVALKTATELDIEIGIFNSPGWSQSGGPWIKPEQAMRYLASRQCVVEGPVRFCQPLPVVGERAQDVKVLAYKEVGQKSSFVPAQPLTQADCMDFVSPRVEVVRSVIIHTVQRPCRSDAELWVKQEDEYRLLRKFEINRSNPAINVGFDPYAPIVLSIPAIQALEFRLKISEASAGIVEAVEFSSVPKVERYPEKTLAKMFQEPLPMWNHYMWREPLVEKDSSLWVNPAQVVDLTAHLNSNGILTWEVPQGRWVILRTAMLPTGQTNSPATPEGTGLEVDKMNFTHVEAHFEAFIGQILKRIPFADRRTFRIVVEDSYETGGQNWTDSMIESFVDRYGYNPVPFLPVFHGVVVGSPQQSDRFLWDIRRLIADKVAYEYVGGLRKISNRHGLVTWLENYGHWGFPGEFLQYGGQSDEIAGEFWSVGNLGDIENKAASSCGHIYGKNKIWAESFTSGGPEFTRYPGEMKQRGDRFFTEGINSTLLHLYVQQPGEKAPGINLPFGNEFNRHNTWFTQLDVFAKYLKRCNYLLQQGQYVADVAYFIGEDTPKMTGVRTPELPRGYSFDYINSEVLLNCATVEQGMLTLRSGMRYHILVLPPQRTMRPQLLRKLKELVAQGLTVLGPQPTHSPSLQDYPVADQEVRQIAQELWQNTEDGLIRYAEYGKGRVYPRASLEEVLTDKGVIPDFYTADPCAPFLFIRRKLPDGELYFVSNQANKMVRTEVSFRVKGKQPEWWDPQLAEIRLLPAGKEQTLSTSLPVALHPYESAFIIFRTPIDTLKGDSESVSVPQQTLVRLTGPWQVTFQQVKGGPRESVLFNELTDWSKHPDERIKYFSGTATYRKTFKMPRFSQAPVYIELGKVMVMAKVRLNGHLVGGVWTPPYRLNITPYLKRGRNELEVEVVNNWRNRLIRDKGLPPAEWITWSTYASLDANSPLQSSGLLGPVEIQSCDYDLFKF